LRSSGGILSRRSACPGEPHQRQTRREDGRVTVPEEEPGVHPRRRGDAATEGILDVEARREEAPGAEALPRGAAPGPPAQAQAEADGGGGGGDGEGEADRGED